MPRKLLAAVAALVLVALVWKFVLSSGDDPDLEPEFEPETEAETEV